MEKGSKVRFGLTGLIVIGCLVGFVALLPTLMAIWDIGSGIFNAAAQKCYPAYTAPCLISAATSALMTFAGLVTYLWLVVTGLKVIEAMPPAGVIYLNLLNQAVTYGAIAAGGLFVAIVGALISRRRQ